MSNLESCVKANKARHYTGVGVLVVTKYLDKPCIILGLEHNKSKKLTEKLLTNSKHKTISSKKKTIIKDHKSNESHTNIDINPNQISDQTDKTNTQDNTKAKIQNELKNKQRVKKQINESSDTPIQKQIYVYEEFGGGIQNNNLTFEENACFELCEETCNLLNFTNPFILNKGINTFFDIPYLKDRLYRLYVVYIEDFTKDIHLFYKNMQVLKSSPSNYFKYRNFTEVSDMTFLEINNIDNYINNFDNYYTINSEERLYNQINKDKGINKFKGVLKCVDNIYLSKRIVDFLNMNFIYDKKLKGYIYYSGSVDDKLNKEIKNKYGSSIKNYKPYTIRGLDFCKYIIKQASLQTDDSNIITLTKPRKNNKHTIKYNFLNHTYSVDGC